MTVVGLIGINKIVWQTASRCRGGRSEVVVDRGEVRIRWIRSPDQLVDVLVVLAAVVGLRADGGVVDGGVVCVGDGTVLLAVGVGALGARWSTGRAAERVLQ